jgi:hypothetical protein
MDELTLFGLFAVTAMLILCAGGSQPVVHFGIRRGLRHGIHLRLFARGVAIRGGRGDLDRRRHLALANSEKANADVERRKKSPVFCAIAVMAAPLRIVRFGHLAPL